MLDVSGSMQNDHKIDRLYDAVLEMINAFLEMELKETIVRVAIITFGEQVLLHTPYTPVAELKKKGIPKLSASGQTPLARALQMAKDIIEDKDITPHGVYAPQVVLVSDGRPYPADHWQDRLEEFVGSGRSRMSQRLALSIGGDADEEMLRKFAGTDEKGNKLMFHAETASDIAAAFKQVTISISKRSKPSIPNTPPQYQGQFDSPPEPQKSAPVADDEDDY